MTDMTSGAKRAAVFLFLFALILGGLNLLWTSHEVAQIRGQQQAQCKFDADLGTAPVLAPKGLKPSLLGVTIVSDARVAWHGLHCPGRLPAATPSFIRWARHYHLPYDLQKGTP